MTTMALLDELHAHDVHLAVQGARLTYDAPVGALTPDLRASLVTRKPEVLAVLGGDWYGAAAALLDQVNDPDRRDDLRFIFEERAAIAEYDGNLPRIEAERVAYMDLAIMTKEVAR